MTSRFKMNWQMNEKTAIKLLISRVDLDDPADIWTLDGSLNTLSDRPGMDSQKTKSYGLKVFHNFNGFDLQSLTSSTDTDVIFSYDADWGNKESWDPFVYDYFSETFRDRKTVSQEFRLVSNEADLINDEKFEWIFGLSYSEIEESNLRQDDGNYGEPSDPYGPYFSQSSSSSDYKSFLFI